LKGGKRQKQRVHLEKLFPKRFVLLEILGFFFKRESFSMSMTLEVLWLYLNRKKNFFEIPTKESWFLD